MEFKPRPTANYKSYLHNKKKHYNKQTKNLNWTITFRKRLNYYTHYIHVPFKWSLILLNNTNSRVIYLYSTTYYLIFRLPNFFKNFIFDLNTSLIVIHNIYENNFTKLYLNYIQKLITLLNNPYFLKIKFKGKGYYIYKNKRNTITPQFGFAHRNYIYASWIKVIFRTKTSILLFGTSIQDILQISYQVKNLRPINIFTGRGVRFNRQVIYKKTGKVSSYR